MFDSIFRIVVIVIFLLWWIYWFITEKQANREKPPQKKITLEQQFARWFGRLAQVVLLLQLAFFSFFPFPQSSIVLQVIGLICVFFGVGISVSARKTLGTNWSHAVEYQVKKKQEIITTGVYAVIRHPIYAGLSLAVIGGELVLQSYLVFFVLLAAILIGYFQAKREEKLLMAHFGDEYKSYMKRTRMFIPYLW